MIWIVAVITALYTMKGGFTTVVYMDAIQTVVLLSAACVLALLGLHRVGGIGAGHLTSLFLRGYHNKIQNIGGR